MQNADLVKFARSAPAIGIATQDRSTVEQVVIETKEALPAPTQEELEATAAYQREMERKRRTQKIQLIGIGALSVLVITAIGAIAFYGFTPVKDTVFRYPTKVLLDGTWVQSKYGTPPIQIQTPQVMLRNPASTAQTIIYAGGNPFEGVYSQLFFEKRSASEEEEKSDQEAQEDAAREILDAAVGRFEALGATNLLIQNDNFTSADGTKALKMSGSLDLMQDEQPLRCRFISIIFPFETSTVELKLIYPKEDRYGAEIEERILNSLEIIKEL